MQSSSTIARNHVDGVVIRSKDGPVLIDYVTKGAKLVASIKFQQTFFWAKLASMVASYASHGPALSNPCVPKLDVMALGTLVQAHGVPDTVTVNSIYWFQYYFK
ncbi:subtilisin-like protease [Olea europaea subsp. europaea]|uniref:Subtilisin-like protease n=1 Tax=Olea europaea subsp. europaea TaxID=158383 RepID=A0A8S0UJE7_OLEEU|nr:subtilisin-like protease [Olea europaea subsp. europaea]